MSTATDQFTETARRIDHELLADKMATIQKEMLQGLTTTLKSGVFQAQIHGYSFVPTEYHIEADGVKFVADLQTACKQSSGVWNAFYRIRSEG